MIATLSAELMDLKRRKNARITDLSSYGAIEKSRTLTPEETEKKRQIETELDDIDKTEDTLHSQMAKYRTAKKRDDDADDDDDDDKDRDDDTDGDKRKKKRKKKRDDMDADQRDDDDDDDDKDRSREEGKERTLADVARGRVGPNDIIIDPKTGRRFMQVGNRRNRGHGSNRTTLREEDLSPAERVRNRRSSLDYRKGFATYLGSGRFDQRAVQQDQDVVGGYLVTPMQIYERILKAVDNMLWIRNMATKVESAGAQSLGVPSIEADPTDPDWTGEITTVQEDSATAFGRRELIPNTLTKLIKVSNKWLRNAIARGFLTANDEGQVPISSAESLIANRFGYKFRAVQENNFLIGNGTRRPLGVFTASSRGISTARDVQTGSATSVTYQGIINTIYSLKAGYNPNWLVSRNFMKIARGLVDNNNRPIVADPLEMGKPEKLMGYPINISEYCPSTFTTGQYVAVFGDWQFYIIVDGLQFAIQKLDQLFALNNQCGFLGYMEADGMPALEEAFARMITN